MLKQKIFGRKVHKQENGGAQDPGQGVVISMMHDVNVKIVCRRVKYIKVRKRKYNFAANFQ